MRNYEETPLVLLDHLIEMNEWAKAAGGVH